MNDLSSCFGKRLALFACENATYLIRLGFEDIRGPFDDLGSVLIGQRSPGGESPGSSIYCLLHVFPLSHRTATDNLICVCRFADLSHLHLAQICPFTAYVVSAFHRFGYLHYILTVFAGIQVTSAGLLPRYRLPPVSGVPPLRFRHLLDIRRAPARRSDGGNPAHSGHCLAPR